MEPIRENANLRFNLRFYKAIGIWAVGSGHKRIYYAWTVAFHSLFTVLYLTSMIVNLVTAYRINDLYITLAEFAMFSKMVNIFKFQDRIHSVLRRFHYEDSFAVNEKDAQEVKFVEEKMSAYTKIATAYKLMSVAAGLMGLLSAFSDPPRMSYPAWFPFGLNDQSVRRNFFLIFVYQNIGMMCHCLMNVTWDNLFIYLMVNLQLQMRLMNERVRKEFLVIDEEENEGKLKRMFGQYNKIMRW